MPYGQFSCVTCFHSEYLRLITDIGDYVRLRNSMYFLFQLTTYNLKLITYNFCYYFFNVNLREARR